MASPHHKPYDAIVVGTGPGGATVARELSEKKQKVLILERGDNWRVRGASWQAALAGAMQRLLDEPETCRHLGDAGRRRARRFTWDRVAEDQERVYEQVVKQ